MPTITCRMSGWRLALVPSWQTWRERTSQRWSSTARCEQDWPAVLELARRCPQVIPSFGYHPWYVNERSADWREVLVRFLDEVPSAIGEIGLDRWMKGHDAGAAGGGLHLATAAGGRTQPAGEHSLFAGLGPAPRDVCARPRPRLRLCAALVRRAAGDDRARWRKLGAYFSLPGYFAHERKTRQRETFRHVPPTAC